MNSLLPPMSCSLAARVLMLPAVFAGRRRGPRQHDSDRWRVGYVAAAASHCAHSAPTEDNTRRCSRIAARCLHGRPRLPDAAIAVPQQDGRLSTAPSLIGSHEGDFADRASVRHLFGCMSAAAMLRGVTQKHSKSFAMKGRLRSDLHGMQRFVSLFCSGRVGG